MMKIYTCNHCDKIHFQCSSFMANFDTIQELKGFGEYLKTIDLDRLRRMTAERNPDARFYIEIPPSSVSVALTVFEIEKAIREIDRYVSKGKLKWLASKDLAMGDLQYN